MFPNLLIFWTCHISHPSFQTSWAMSLEPLFWAQKEKDGGDSRIPTSEISVLNDRVHSSGLSWGMPSATGDCQELFSGKMVSSHDFRNINCGVELQRNPRVLVLFGLHGKAFASGSFTGVASMGSCWKIPPCPTEPVPVSSRMDPRLSPSEMTAVPLG